MHIQKYNLRYGNSSAKRAESLESRADTNMYKNKITLIHDRRQILNYDYENV